MLSRSGSHVLEERSDCAGTVHVLRVKYGSKFSSKHGSCTRRMCAPQSTIFERAKSRVSRVVCGCRVWVWVPRGRAVWVWALEPRAGHVHA